MWDDESGITVLRKYYTLREEAQDTVVHSKRVWLDTPFSIYATQCKHVLSISLKYYADLLFLPAFSPPRHPAGMQALLQHSLENYGPLPPELRRIRSRTQSRPSPYPQARPIKTSISPDQSRPFLDTTRSFVSSKTLGQTPLQPGFNQFEHQFTCTPSTPPRCPQSKLPFCFRV